MCRGRRRGEGRQRDRGMREKGAEEGERQEVKGCGLTLDRIWGAWLLSLFIIHENHYLTKLIAIKM